MIRHAEYKDIEKIMGFIGEYWKKDHILSRDRVLFEFQYQWQNETSFIISEGENGEINGILGFIPYDSSDRDVMLAIWKTLKTKDSMLGIKMLNVLRDDASIKSTSVTGINPETIPIYHFLGIHTGMMNHWYRLSKVKDYKIAYIENFTIPAVEIHSNADVKKYSSYKEIEEDFGLEECILRCRHPFKSMKYIRRRYFEHPVFEYLKYGIIYQEKKLLVICRIQEYKDSKIIRVIDGIGDDDLFMYFTCMLDSEMQQLGCEYADLYETGLNDDNLINAGWTLRNQTNNIIPEYFSPYEQKNVDIYYMSEIPNVVLFKGDGDMDRPN